MRKLQSASSRWLLGIAVAAVILIVASVIVAIVNRQKEGDLISEDRPEGVTQRYLLALREGEFSKAYEYLNSSLQKDCTYGDFLNTVRYYENRDAGVSLVKVDTLDGKQEVIVRITEYYANPPFGGNEYTQTIHYVLEQESDGWRFSELPYPLSWCPGLERKVPSPVQ